MTLTPDYTIPSSIPFDLTDSSPFSMDSTLQSYKERDKWLKLGMFAFVCWDWVIPFTAWIGNRRCLEVMSGAGWLAKALREKNIDIIATDDYSWGKRKGWPVVSEVIEMNAMSAILNYAHQCDILIISWPYMNDDAYHAIKAAHDTNPTMLVVYIGEGDGGCTASDRFFEHFEEIEQQEFNEIKDQFKSWWGIHDTISVGRFRGKEGTHEPFPVYLYPH